MGYVTTHVTKGQLSGWLFLYLYERIGRGEWIRTTDLLVPNKED
jgi:hypothetical protein